MTSISRGTTRGLVLPSSSGCSAARSTRAIPASVRRVDIATSRKSIPSSGPCSQSRTPPDLRRSEQRRASRQAGPDPAGAHTGTGRFDLDVIPAERMVMATARFSRPRYRSEGKQAPLSRDLWARTAHIPCSRPRPSSLSPALGHAWPRISSNIPRVIPSRRPFITVVRLTSAPQRRPGDRAEEAPVGTHCGRAANPGSNIDPMDERTPAWSEDHDEDAGRPCPRARTPSGSMALAMSTTPSERRMPPSFPGRRRGRVLPAQ